MSRLTDPGRIGQMTLKNRMIMAPMGVHLGNMTDSVAAFYKERAAGGAGMIEIGCMASGEIEDSSASMLITEESKEKLTEIVEAAHDSDCKVCLQIMLGCGRVGGPSARYGGLPMAASEVPWHHMPDMMCQEISREDIHFLEDEFRKTLTIGIEAGIDAVELHFYGGYLGDQFLTKRWNKRTDEYGGNLDGRMRLLNEVIDISREAGGEKLAVIVKYTPDHLLEGEDYRHIEEGIEIAKRLEARGVDALHVCAGCYDNWENGMPPVYFQEMTPHIKSAREIKKHVSIPVIAHGRLGDISKADMVIRENMADYAGIARGLLADPDLPQKVTDGKIRDIIPCISCDEGCIASVYMGGQVTCAVNPFCGYENRKVLKKTNAPKKILVIGGGPAGVSAAIFAKQAGHEVTLWEAKSRIGGNALAASMPVFKRDMERLICYYEHMLEKLDIPVYLLKKASLEEVGEFAPDHIIWAAGGNPLRPKSIEGLDGENVVLAADALKNNALLGQKLAVIGGGLVGCEAAAHFALLGKDVSVIEMAPTILPEMMFPQNKIMLEKWMAKAGLTLYEGSKLLSVDEKGIVIEKDDEKKKIDCDTVVLAMGYTPKTKEAEAYESVCPVTVIGDSVKAGKIVNATSEALDSILALS